MTGEIAGYQLDAELHQGTASCVYRGLRLRDGLPVVVKLLRNEFPTPQETARLEREFRIGSPLRLEYCVQALESLRAGHRSVLVFADDGAVSLDRWFGTRPLAADAWLAVVIAATRALAEFHDTGLIHGDVNPGNLVIHPGSGVVKLIDLELARRLDDAEAREVQGMGTLAYMAPEQSGRGGRRADARADLYALGASLFELASGRPVFVDRDDASLRHAHFALAPPSLCELRPGFPAVLGALVGKLLAKRPQDRYQSAAGLLADLEQVAHGLRQGRPLDDMELGSADDAPGLVHMDHLIGRERLLARLHGGREQALHDGRPVWLHLLGAAGAGKSSLMARFAEALPAENVMLAGGGQPQAQAAPYVALVAAFDCLLRRWLAVDEAQLAELRAELDTAAAGNLAVLEALLPRLPRLVGDLPTPPPLVATAERERFLAAWFAFLKVATAHQRPLLFFIDDLQWVDAASLTLIERLLGSELAPCLLVTAQRADTPAPALAAWFARLDSAGVRAETLELPPLSRGQIGELLDDCLGAVDGGAPARDSLAEVLLAKTAGNPFFIRQLLGDLVRDGALRAHAAPDGARWRFDHARAASLAVADNVLALLGNRIGSLPAPLRAVLVHAACIGPQFDRATLAAVLVDGAADAVADELGQLTRLGQIRPLPDADRYQFIHERIREAVLAQADADARARIHLAIGRHWQGHGDHDGFAVVGQLNLGMALIQSEDERERLALRNADAARQARALAAYDASLDYAGHALALLPTASARRSPGLQRDLQTLLAEAQASAGRLDEAIASFEAALTLADDDRARAHVLERLADALQSSGQPAQALLQVQRALELLGQPLQLAAADDASAQQALAREQETLFATLGEPGVLDALAGLGVADEAAAQIGRLYDKAVIGVYFSCPDKLGFVTARSVAHVLATGLTPEAGLAFAWWSMILCLRDRHALATRFAHEVRAIHARFGNDYYGGAGRMVAAAMTLSWTCPYAESFAEAGESARLLNLSGNMQFASYGLITQHIIAVTEAVDCQSMLATCQTWADYCARHVPLELGQAQIRRYCIERLMGLDPEELDCEAIVAGYEAAGNATDVCESLTEMARFALLSDDFEACLALCERADPYFCAGAAGNLLLNFNHQVMLALASARCAARAADTLRARLHARFDAAAARVQRLAALQPQNFSAWENLVRAEGARMRGDLPLALTACFAAIQHAHQHGYLLLLAQGTQYLAELLQVLGHHRAAGVQRDADQLYRRAGCLGKLAGRVVGGRATTTDVDGKRGSRASDVALGVDVLSLMKANEAIASETDYDRLLVRLLEIAVENAGAQRGVLALQEDGVLTLVAVSGQGRVHERLEGSTRCPVQMVRFVARSGQAAVLDSGAQRSAFRDDPYFQAHPARSLLALPVLRQGAVLGVLVLENDAVDGAFADERMEAIRLLLGAAAIALENAALFSAAKHHADVLEERVRERTRELEHANAALARLADLDGLTQIANRRRFDRVCERYAEQRADVVLLLCDVDDFKAYNDRYGHPAGDEVLRRVAAALAALELPGDGVVARYGGEEFVIVLRGVAPARAERFAAEVHRCVGRLGIEHRHSRAGDRLSLSVGMARAPQLTPAAIAGVIADADKALYVAKQSGRNRVSLHADFHRDAAPFASSG